MMSAQSECPRMPAAAAFVRCESCGREVAYKPCQSDARGNRGKLVAVCIHENDPDIGANFIRWQSTPSPSLPSTSSFPMTAAPPLPSSAKQCLVPGCTISRIRKGCSNQRCKVHCLASSMPCAAPTHKKQASVPLSQPFTLPSESTTPTVIDPQLSWSPIQPFSQQPLSPQPLSQQPLSQQPPQRSGPVYASHITDIFNDSLAAEVRVRDQKRHDDAARLVNARKANQSVLVYVWTEENKDPAITEFQSGFTWPFFIIDTAILTELGLDLLAPGVYIKFYRPIMQVWTKISHNHVIDLSSLAERRIFLKSSQVFLCHDLDRHATGDPYSNRGRLNISRQRAHIRASLDKLDLSNILADISAPRGESQHPVTPRSQPPRPSSVTIPLPSSPPAPKGDWPGNRTVNEIVDGFIRIKELTTLPGYTISSAFETHFKVRFVSATWYEHKERWAGASDVDRERARMDNGAWSTFAQEHPTKKAEVKALRKRHRRQQQAATGSSSKRRRCQQEDDIEQL